MCYTDPNDIPCGGNDMTDMQAYGFKVGEMTESMCVAELMKMYQRLTDKQ